MIDSLQEDYKMRNCLEIKVVSIFRFRKRRKFNFPFPFHSSFFSILFVSKSVMSLIYSGLILFLHHLYVKRVISEDIL